MLSLLIRHSPYDLRPAPLPSFPSTSVPRPAGTRSSSRLLLTGICTFSFSKENDPVEEQVRVSVGLEYQINEQWTVGGSYTFMWLGKNELDQTRPISGRIAGDYDAFGHIFGFYGALRF